MVLVVVIVLVFIVEGIPPSNPENNPQIVECRINNKQKLTPNETDHQKVLRLKDFKRCLNLSWSIPIWRKFHCDVYYKTGGKMEDWCYGFNLP